VTNNYLSIEPPATTSRWTRVWVVITSLSVYGPYVVVNARTEQIVVFLSAFGILLFGWPKVLEDHPCPAVPIFVCWSGLYSVIILATVYPHIDLGAYGQFSPSHGLADFALPPALIIVSWFWTLVIPTRDLILLIARTTIAGMVVNTVISVCQLATNNVLVFSVLPHFWSAANGNAGSSTAVSVAAAGNGRFTGIFNQPAEAGVAYGVALFCLIYLSQVDAKSWTKMRTAYGVALTIGGILTISKIFLLGGLPVALILLMRAPANRMRAIISFSTIGFSLWLLGTYGLLPTWVIGPSTLRRIFSSSNTTLTTITAGRYGADGTLAPLAADILHSSPLVGFGAGGIAAPYDSMWLEALAVSGILGVLLVCFVFIFLFARWTRLRWRLPRPEWHLSGATLVIAFGGSFGLPTLTGNRVSTLLWLIIGVLIVSQPSDLSQQHIQPGQRVLPRTALAPAHRSRPANWTSGALNN